MPAIRVLVVDDSALMREMISDVLSSSPGLEVVGKARDGRQALELLQKTSPDVVTLDVEMPFMNGLDTLEAILRLRPTPVVMVSALTQRGATTTLEALDRGALDYVTKPDSPAGVEQALREELVRKIRWVAGTDVKRMLQIRRDRNARRQQRTVTPPAPPLAVAVAPAAAKSVAKAVPADPSLADRLIAIGISTGGPPALSTLFETLKAPQPPIVIVQHMPAQFTKAFAWRLNSISPLEVKEAETGDVLRPGAVYIAPGGRHLTLKRSLGQIVCSVFDGDPVSGHRPSVDVLMKAAADLYGSRCLGVIMTGMGRDGVQGCGAIRAAGGYVLGQDEATSDVYGMNKAAFAEGHVDRQFALDDAATIISQQVRRLSERKLVGTT